MNIEVVPGCTGASRYAVKETRWLFVGLVLLSGSITPAFT